MALEHLPFVRVLGPGVLPATALDDGHVQGVLGLAPRRDAGGDDCHRHDARCGDGREPRPFAQGGETDPDRGDQSHEEEAAEGANCGGERRVGLAHGEGRQRHPAERPRPAG